MNIFNVIKQKLRSRIHVSPNASKDAVIEFVKKLRPIYYSDMQRIGGTGDGSYVLPKNFTEIEYCVSPGVSTEINFDLEVAKHCKHVYLFDASIKTPSNLPFNVTFFNKYVGPFEDENKISLGSFIDNVPSNAIMLQMDIEGDEYETLLSLNNEQIQKFEIMAIEFHNIDKYLTKYSIQFLSYVFSKILSTHDIIFIQANNVKPLQDISGVPIPPMLEITFIKKRAHTIYKETFGDDLIIQVKSDRKPINLDQIWDHFL